MSRLVWLATHCHLPEVHHPGIGEASNVVVGLALIGSRRVVDAGNFGGIPEEIHLYVLNVGQGRLEAGIFDIGQESLLVAHFTVPLRIDETAGNQGIEGGRIAIHLSLIPQALEHHQFALARIGLLRGQCDRAEEEVPADSSR